MKNKKNGNNILFVTGISGAGKSTALKSLEDLGYFCVDNLPVIFVTKFLDVFSSSTKINKIAIGIDVREKSFLNNTSMMLADLSNRCIPYKIYFFEAKDEVLLRRFSETRRKHPLSDDKKSVRESIVKEKKLLKELRDHSDVIIDTSEYNAKDLREIICDLVSQNKKSKKLMLHVISFGYKYGLPLEADMIFDVRFLPNPYYNADLRIFTGNDEKIKKFVLNNTVAEKFLKKLEGLLSFLLPCFKDEGKAYLTIAIGCTGGKHRSVSVANEIKNMFSNKNIDLRVIHRDILK